MTDIKKGATPLFLDKDGKTRVFLCSTERVDKYPNGVDAFLDLLGIKGALVTDASSVGDFIHDENEATAIDRLNAATNVKVERRTLVWMVARILEGQMK